MRVSRDMILGVQQITQSLKIWGTIICVLLSIPFCLSGHCSYRMEVVLRTKTLEKSKKAILRLKVCLVVSIVAALLGGFKILENPSHIENSFVNFVLVPLITFVGAFFANKLIEKKDKFVKVSSYNNDSYL